MSAKMDPLAQMVADTATQILLSGDELAPIAFSILDDPDEGLKLVMVPVPPFTDQKEKMISFGLALSLAKAFGSNRLLTVTDAWMAVVEADEVDELGGYPKPSERLDRKEALVVTDGTELGIQTHILEYSRGEDGMPVTKGEWVTTDESTNGAMLDLMAHINAMPKPSEEELKMFLQLAELAGTTVTIQ